MMFCLDDGAELLYGPATGDEPATAIMHETSPPGEAATRAQIHTTDHQTLAVPGSGEGSRQTLAGRKGLVVLSVIAVVALAGFFAYRYLDPRNGAIDSIAVLPFTNATGDKEVDFLADGIAETLINNFTKIPDLKVTARSTAFRFRGREGEPQAIGRDLGVGSILTGKLFRRGENVSIQVDLVKAADGLQIWGNRYEGKISDIVNIQQRIAADVSQQLRLKLTGAQAQQVAKTYTQDSQAYQLYLRGRFYWNKRTAENIRKAMEQFQQAADADPNYALAYSGLADCYVVLGDYTGGSETDTVPKVQAFAKRALELDGTLVEPQTSLAYSYQQLWQWTEAEREFKRAIALDPNYATAHHWYNLLLMETGRFSEGLVEIKRAQELDPLSPIISYNVALNYLVAGDVNAAVEQSKRIIDLDPNFPRAHQSLGQAYLKQNRYDEAIAEFQKAVDLSPNDRQSLRDLGYGYAVAQKRDSALSVLRELKSNYEKGEAYPQDVAAVYVGLGEMDQAFAWLEKSLETRTGRLGRIGYHIPFESLRRDPRYTHLRRRMGLPQ